MSDIDRKLKQLGIEPRDESGYLPPSESEIQALEARIGTRLPDDYREFLSRYGCSNFELAVSFPSTIYRGGYIFGSFFGANACGYGVLSQYINHEEEFPAGLIPFADASLGDLYFLATTGPNRGTVYFWLHDGADPMSDDGLDQLAPTFTDFILGLQPDDDWPLPE